MYKWCGKDTVTEMDETLGLLKPCRNMGISTTKMFRTEKQESFTQYLFV